MQLELRHRHLLLFAAASLAAVALGAVILAQSGTPFGSWMRNPLAWLVGGLLAAALAAATRTATLATGTLVLAALFLAATLFAPARDGVHRWVDLGPLHVNVAALLLPPGVVALAFAVIWTRWALALAAVIAGLLVLQPDASQATAFLAAAILLLIRSDAPAGRRYAAIAMALLLIAAAWARPDPLEPVAEVEEIFSLAWTISPPLALVALLALAAASLAPLAAARGAGKPPRDAALALTVYFAAAALCPALGAFPVPLVGLGMSFPVGWWLGVALLCMTPAPAAPGS
jgi:cell division protein FtsW (lipid II flippase)